LATVVQHSAKKAADADLIFITHQISRQQHLDIVHELNETPQVIGVLSHYRVEGEE
jgi:homoserine dehydrogenase